MHLIGIEPKPCSPQTDILSRAPLHLKWCLFQDLRVNNCLTSLFSKLFSLPQVEWKSGALATFCFFCLEQCLAHSRHAANTWWMIKWIIFWCLEERQYDLVTYDLVLYYILKLWEVKNSVHLNRITLIIHSFRIISELKPHVYWPMWLRKKYIIDLWLIICFFNINAVFDLILSEKNLLLVRKIFILLWYGQFGLYCLNQVLL